MSEQKSLNILIVLPALEMGGVEQTVIDTAVFLKKSGHNPIIISAGGRKVIDLKRFNIRHIQAPVNSKSIIQIWRNISTIEKAIKENQIDIVTGESRAPAWSAYFAAKKTKRPFVTTFHAAYGFGPLELKKVYNKIMTKGQFIIAPSFFIKNHLEQHYKNISDKIAVIHRWIDVKKYGQENISYARVEKLIQDFNIPEDKKIITTIGRLSPIKGHEEFIKGFAKTSDLENTIALIVGNSNKTAYIEKIENLIRELNLEGKVFILKSVEDIPVIYSISDVIVLPSTKPESFGLCALEAQTSGKYTIASNFGGFTEIIKDGKTGKLIDCSDSDLLASSIDEALNFDEETNKTICTNAIKNAKMNFDMNVILPKILTIYNLAIETFKKKK